MSLDYSESSIEEILLTGFTKKRDNNVFEVSVYSDGVELHLMRRYSDFASFHKALLLRCRSYSDIELPCFPSFQALFSKVVGRAGYYIPNIDQLSDYCMSLVANLNIQFVHSFFDPGHFDLHLKRRTLSRCTTLVDIDQMTKNCNKYIVIADYQDGVFKIEAGEVVNVLGSDHAGWHLVMQVLTGGKMKSGWLPDVYLLWKEEGDPLVEEIHAFLLDQRSQESQMPSRFSDSPDDLPPDSLKYNTYRITSDTTMYNINCQSVSLDRGATVIVIDKDGSGWWYVSSPDCDGWVPSTVLEPKRATLDKVDYDSVCIPEQNTPDYKRPVPYYVVQDYFARQSDELCCGAGDVIEVLYKSNSGWWTIRTQDSTGLFPAVYLSRDKDKPPAVSGVGTAYNIGFNSSLAKDPPPRRTTISDQSPTVSPLSPPLLDGTIFEGNPFSREPSLDVHPSEEIKEERNIDKIEEEEEEKEDKKEERRMVRDTIPPLLRKPLSPIPMYVRHDKRRVSLSAPTSPEFDRSFKFNLYDMERTPQFGRHSNQLSAPRKISDVSHSYRSPSPIPLRFYRKISSSKSPTPMPVDEDVSDTNSVSFLNAVSERLKGSPQIINKEISEEEERDDDIMSDDEDMANLKTAASGRKRLSSLKQFRTLGNVKFCPEVSFRETIDKEDDKRKGAAGRRLGAQNTFYKKQGTIFSSHSDSEEEGEIEGETERGSEDEQDDHDGEDSLVPFTLPTIVKTSPEVKRRLSSPHVSESSSKDPASPVIEKPIPVPVDSESRITRTDSDTVRSYNLIPSPKTAFRLSPKVKPIPHLRISDEHKLVLDSSNLVPENGSFSPDIYERPESPEIIVAAISDESSFNEELKLISKPKLMMAEEPGHAWGGHTHFSTGSIDETSFMAKETSLRHSLPVGNQTVAISGSLSLEDISLEDAIDSASPKPLEVQNNENPVTSEPVIETGNVDEDNHTYSGSLASHVPAGYMAESLVNDTQLKSLMAVPPDQLQRSHSLSPDYSNEVDSYYPRKYSERCNSLSPVDNVTGDGQSPFKRGSFHSLSPLEKERISFYSNRHRSLSPLEREMLYDSNPSLRRHSLSPVHYPSSTHQSNSNSLSSPSSPLHSNESSSSACDHVPLPSSPTYERPLSATDHPHFSQSNHTSFHSSLYYQRPLSAIDYSSLPSERTRQPSTSPRHRSLSPLYSMREDSGFHSMGYKRRSKSPQQQGEQADQVTTPSDLSTAFLNFQKRAKNKILHENQHKL